MSSSRKLLGEVAWDFLNDAVRRNLRNVPSLRSECKLLSSFGLVMPLTYEDEKRVLRMLENMDYQPNTVRKYMRLVRRIENWYCECNGIPLKGTKLPNLPKPVHRTRVLWADEVATLKKKVKQCVNPELELLFDVLIETGVRIGEALILTSDDVTGFFGTPILVVKRPKTRTQTTIAISKSLAKRLQEFRVAFPEETRKRVVAQLRHLINVCLNTPEDVKYKGRATIHTLRHTFATRALASGVPLSVVSYALGHASLSQTMHYTHLVNNAEAADACLKVNWSELLR